MRSKVTSLTGIAAGLALAGLAVLPASAATRGITDVKNDAKTVAIKANAGAIHIHPVNDEKVDIRRLSVTNTKDAVFVDITVQKLRLAKLDSISVQLRTAHAKKATYALSMDPAHPDRATLVETDGRKIHAQLLEKGIAITGEDGTKGMIRLRIGSVHISAPHLVSASVVISRQVGGLKVHEDATGTISKAQLKVEKPKPGATHWTPRTSRG